MKIHITFRIVAALALGGSLSCAAQERGYWQAASNTAASITGDISISEAKITINFKSFPLASIRNLNPAEVSAVFDADANALGPGTLYRLRIPADQRFLHKNTLCGAQDTQWIAAYVVGKSLQVAFFSGDDAPKFTIDAIATRPTSAEPFPTSVDATLHRTIQANTPPSPRACSGA